MVPTQDFTMPFTPLHSIQSFDLLPAGIVAVVLVAFAIALITVSVLRRDAD
jgi:hypothetical protein